MVEGGRETNSGETRFAVVRPSGATDEEKGRIDYPFAMWSSTFVAEVRDGGGAATVREMGELLQLAGVGKQTCCQLFLLNDFFSEGADPQQRLQNLDQNIAQTRKTIAVLRQYGMHPIGWICPGQEVVPPAKDPILADTIRRLVTGLKDDIRLWGYGSEHIVGGIDLDATTGFGPGGERAMSWGRKGSPRQWWREYLVAYDAAKEANPACRFGPFTTCDTSGTIVRDFFRVSPEKKLDCFEMNMYANAFNILPAAYAEFRKAGLPNVPFFANEMAIHSAYFPEAPSEGPGKYEPDRQGGDQPDDVLGGDAAGLPATLLWAGECPPDERRARRLRLQTAGATTVYRVRHHDGPAGRRQVHRQIRSPRRTGVCARAGGPPGIVGVMWSTGKEGVAELEVGVRAVEISDVWGNRRTLKAKNGVVAIPLTPMPQYVLGAKTIKLAPSVSLALANTSLDPADPQVTVTIKNERKAASQGTLTLLPGIGHRCDNGEAGRGRHSGGCHPELHLRTSTRLTPLPTSRWPCGRGSSPRSARMRR